MRLSFLWRKDMMIDKWFETCTSIFQIGTYVENRNQLKNRKYSWLGNGKLYIPIYVPVSWSKWSIAITSKLPLSFPLLSFWYCCVSILRQIVWCDHITLPTTRCKRHYSHWIMLTNFRTYNDLYIFFWNIVCMLFSSPLS